MKVLITGGSGFIGTNLIDYLHSVRKKVVILNVDIKQPVKDEQRLYWQECDILDVERLKRVFAEFHPTHVVHLAARTDTDSQELNDYHVNTHGSLNVLEAIKITPSITRVIITSTQFVCKPGRLPEHEEDFDPHTAYGQSKVISEKLTRATELTCVWTIVRPTNVWGAWHPRYPDEFWRVLQSGRYFHPSGRPVIRSYGYVGNVCFQIEKILQAPVDLVDRKVYYVGDMPIELLDWVNGFSRAVTGRNVRIVPRAFVRCLALIGDVVSLFGMRFPIHSSRFRSMTTDYLTPMTSTVEAFGEPPFSLDQGIKETVMWLKNQGYVQKIYV